jgi:glycosyltransferase involved in cell wall biosynthesis
MKRSSLTPAKTPANREPAPVVTANGEPAALNGRALRKALVLAYRFPPQGGGGVQRSLKFVKYLPGHGWLPVVHTVSNPYWPLEDRTLLAEVPQSVKVYRTPTFEFERLGRAAAGALSTNDSLPAGDSPRTSAAGSAAAPRKRGGLARRCLQAVGDFLFRHVLIPDSQIAWVPGALVRSLVIAHRERVSLVYSSSPPNSGQVLALLLKRLSGRPWLADFRDEWTEGIRRKLAYQKSPLRGRIEAALERLVVRHADHVVVTTDKARDHFLEKYPFAPREKFSVITNGFDPGDFAAAPAAERLLDDRHFNMTLTGNVEAMFDAVPFFSAVRELLDEDEGARAHLRVNFIGTRRGKYDDFIREHRLDSNVRYVGYVPHQTCLRYLAESNVLFLCQIPVYESAAAKLSGKLFEYLYMRKPILALTLPGLTADILARSGLGTVVDPNDQPGIRKAIRDLYLAWRDGHARAPADEAYINTFDRVTQTERLAGLFDRLAEPAA